MIKIIKSIVLSGFAVISLSCNTQKTEAFAPKVLYKSDDLIITQVSPNAFQHTSYLQTETWGKVPCNGLLVKDQEEAIVYDTPTTNPTSEELIQWITDNLHTKIKAVVPTHFHDDCLGGLKAFHNHQIASYANTKTIELAKENHYEVPQNAIIDSISIKIGNKTSTAKYFGEGHTKDNIVGYFPSENIMFGGCLIKELDATKGYLGDANVDTWSNTVEKVRAQYPNVRVVIPGHGDFGDKKLLDYTINLFKVK